MPVNLDYQFDRSKTLLERWLDHKGTDSSEELMTDELVIS